MTHSKQNNWLCFFYFLTFLVQDVRWKVILQELHRKFGLYQRNKAIPQWLSRAQAAMGDVMVRNGHYVLGGSKSVIVVDETAWGKGRGVSKKPMKPAALSRRALAQVRVKERKPVQTVWAEKGKRITRDSKARKAKEKPGPKRSS